MRTSCCVFTSLPSALADVMVARLDAAHGSICAPHQATLLNCSAALAPESICTQRAPLGAMLCTQILLQQQLPRGRGRRRRLFPTVGEGASQQDPVFLSYSLLSVGRRSGRIVRHLKEEPSDLRFKQRSCIHKKNDKALGKL